MFIHVSNFYKGAEDILPIVNQLPLLSKAYGAEVDKFYMIPEGIESGFERVLNIKVQIKEPSGVFRVPYPVIHFEDCDKQSLYTAVIALEPTTFTTHRHKETGYTSVLPVGDNIEQFVKENCFKNEKWEDVAKVTLQPNDLVIYKPWIWHSFAEKYIKVFNLEAVDA